MEKKSATAAHTFKSGIHLPESPKVPMEFLSRSWSVSALEVSKALTSKVASKQKSSNSSSTTCSTNSIPEEADGRGEIQETNTFFHLDDNLSSSITAPANQFSFASTANSQLLLERIMSQSEVSPLTSGRLSHSSGVLNLPESDSTPVSPSAEFEDIVKYFQSHNSFNPLFSGNGRVSCGTGAATPGGGGSKTVGRWLKERKERKKEEARAHNAHLHAAVSVAAVASAVAAMAAATASASSASGKNELSAKTDMAMASAATLVAAQCVEAAEDLGVERDLLASIVSSAVNVCSPDDITTLTAAAATALRGAATLKARALKDVLNVASVIPLDRGIGICGAVNGGSTFSRDSSDELIYGEDFLGVCSLEYLARGSELLKRTRKGDLHWKVVSVYLNRTGQVILKMKSRRVAGTITKKDKHAVLELCNSVPAWPGRHLLHDGDQRRYFGLKTSSRGMVEFECKNQREHEIWTHGVSKLLFMASQRRRF